MAPACCLGILGPVEVWSEGQQLTLGGPQQVALLALLVLYADRAVSTDVMVDALWREEGEDARVGSGSRKRVQMAITRLRQTLAPLGGRGLVDVQTVAGGYLLSLSDGVLDAAVFEAGVTDGRRALQASDPDRAHRILSAALDLWRGPPLAQVGFWDFAQAEIRRLEELRLIAVEARVDADFQLGRHARVTDELSALVVQHPDHEHLAAQLMLALYRCGRQAEALTVFERARRYLADELGLRPGPELRGLQDQILNHDPILTGEVPQPAPGDEGSTIAKAGIGQPARFQTRRVVAPAAATPTVGRSEETRLVVGLLSRPEVRLVTLTGPGGVGKTRLAAEVARAVELQLDDGVRWVELAGVARVDDVPAAVAQALDITPVHEEHPREATPRFLSGKELLLVMDNCEHLLPAAEFLAELLSVCPALTVLATSREALSLSAEHRVVIAPLTVPPALASSPSAVADVMAADAGALFVAAAQRHDHRFTVDASTAPAIARICTRLDGLPLALELAAARTNFVSVAELADELDATIADLAGGPQDAPSRQRTMRDAIEWSYRLLSPGERVAFTRFAVFAGGAGPRAASAVTGAGQQTLEALMAKSLLVRDLSPDGTARLAMLEPIRQYAMTKLTDNSELAEVRARHLDWVLDLVHQMSAKLNTHEDDNAVAALDREVDNIRAALTWSLVKAPQAALRLTGQLGEYWLLRAEPDALGLTGRALNAAGAGAEPRDRARAYLLRSRALSLRSQAEVAAAAAEEALTLFQSAGDSRGMSRALMTLANIYAHRGDTARTLWAAEEACRHADADGDAAVRGNALARLAISRPSEERLAMLERAARLLNQAGDYRDLATIYMNAGYHELRVGRVDDATRLFEIAAEAERRRPSPQFTMFLSGNLGLANLFAARLDAARRAFERQLRLCLQHTFRFGADEGLAGAAAIAACDTDDGQAAVLLGAAHALGYPTPHDRPIYDRLDAEFFTPARARYGTLAWQRSHGEGAGLSPEQAITRALSGFSGPRPSSSP